MHEGASRIHIKAPPDRLYAMVSDVTRMGEWSPECYRCEWLGGARGAAVGARFRGYSCANWLRWSRLVEVTAADPGREFAFTTLEDFVNKDSTTWRYTFEPAAGGTVVTESYQIWRMPNLPIRILTWLAQRPHDMRPHMQSTLERLKAKAEQEVAHAGQAPVEPRLPPVTAVERAGPARRIRESHVCARLLGPVVMARSPFIELLRRTVFQGSWKRRACAHEGWMWCYLDRAYLSEVPE